MEHKPFSALSVDRMIEVSQGDFSPEGTLLGGRVMKVVDSLAAIVAERHAGRPCTTLGIDAVRFLNPAKQGDLLICTASLYRTCQTSMEVGVKVVAEDFRTLEQKDIFSARFTFVIAGEDQERGEHDRYFEQTQLRYRRLDTLISRSNG